MYTDLRKQISSFLAFIADNDRCEEGWKYNDGSCYLRVNQRKSWKKAQSDCKAKNANLVTVNDLKEQNYVGGGFGKKGSWCGLNNRDDMNKFTWISGEQSDFTYWAPNEPKKRKKKRCVHISKPKQYKWRMAKCGAKLRYTCEKGLLIFT